MCLSIFALFSWSVLNALPAPQEILKIADTFRSPSGAFEMSVRVEEQGKDDSAFRVLIDGNEKSMIVTEAPPRDLGRNVLMLDRDMWMFMPSINRSVRIALRQKLVGQVALGDISRMKWFGDYEATMASGPNGQKKIEQKEGVAALRLELKASRENLTYDKISLWVDPKDYRPLFAEFQTPNGRPLKFARFENFGNLAGATRVRTIRIQDALRASDSSTIQVLAMKGIKVPSGFFSQNNLQKPRLP